MAAAESEKEVLSVLMEENAASDYGGAAVIDVQMNVDDGNEDHEQEEGEEEGRPTATAVVAFNAAASNEATVNLYDTLHEMVYRRLQREKGGYYKEQDAVVRYGNNFFSLLIAALAVSAGAAGSWDQFVFSMLVGILLIVLIRKIFGAYKFILLWFFVGWIAMTLITGSLLGLFTSNYASGAERSYAPQRTTSWAFICIMSALTFLTDWLSGPFYMSLVKDKKVGLHGWFNLKPGRHRCEMTYHSSAMRLIDWVRVFLRLFCSCVKPPKPVHVGYMGGVDEDNRPHGGGVWTENHPHGEELAGLWCHGKLSCPFQSTEKGSGYAFSSVRIAVVRNRLDKLTSNDYVSKFDPEGLSIGVASVECSVSGKFFKHLPQVQYIHLPAHNRTANWAVSQLITPADVYVKGDTDFHTIEITRNRRSGQMLVNPIGLEPIVPEALRTVTVTVKEFQQGATYDVEQGVIASSGGGGGGGGNGSGEEKRSEKGETSLKGGSDDDVMDRSNTKIEGDAHARAATLAQFNADLSANQLAFVLDTWKFMPKSFEAVILIPGYNACTDFSMATLAQLLTLGHFPPTIHPFLWSWPSCWMLTYSYAKKNGLDKRMTEDFQVFLGQLKEANVRKLHIMTHSAGLRVFMTMIKGIQGYLAPLPKGTTGSLGTHHVDSMTDDNDLIALETVTMMNGDYELDSFLAPGGGYDILRAYCPVLTIYADETDGALGYLELLTRKYTVGTSTYRMKRPVTVEEDEEEKQAAATTGQFLLGGSGGNADERAAAKEKARGSDRRMKWLTSGNMETKEKLPPQLDEFRASSVLLPPSDQELVVQEKRKRLRRKEKGDVSMVPLDLDVIDMKWLEQNIHAMRHSFFNINPVLVQDLREIIVHKRRASQRGNTRSQGGNVYSFMIAPEVYKMP